MKRVVMVTVVVLLLAGGAFYWWRAAGHEEPPGLTLYGNVDIRQVELGFRVAGRIAAMAVEEGDTVAPGTRLATLDRQPYLDERAMAQAGEAQARAQLAKLEAGTRPGEIHQARALVAEREATLANARRELARRRELRGSGAVSRQALDEALARAEEAEARLRSAREALELALEGPRREDIEAARAALAAARARVQAAETALADTELKAPAAGTILTRVREPGAVVAAGATVYTLALAEPVWVRAYVPEPDLGRLQPGMPAQVYSDARPQRPYPGQVGFISPVAEFTPRSVETPELRSALVYRLRVVVDSADPGLRQGMPVTVQLPTAPARESGDD